MGVDPIYGAEAPRNGTHRRPPTYAVRKHKKPIPRSPWADGERRRPLTEASVPPPLPGCLWVLWVIPLAGAVLAQVLPTEPPELAGPIAPGAQWGQEATRDGRGSAEAREAEQGRVGAPAGSIHVETEPERRRRVLREDLQTAARLTGPMLERQPALTDDTAVEIAVAIAKWSRNWGLRPELVSALAFVESAYDPNCQSDTSDFGLLQLHNQPIYGIQANVEAGCVHLHGNLTAAGGDERRALQLYNGGPNGPRLAVCQRYADKVLKTERGAE